MAIFGPKPWVNPVGKMLIFRLFEHLVFIDQKGVFLVLEYRKRDFPGLYCLKTKRLEKWPFFGPKPWVNPLGKLSIFRIFELLVFIAQKGGFFFQNIVKDIFLAQIALKKWKNGHFWTKTMGQPLWKNFVNLDLKLSIV